MKAVRVVEHQPGKQPLVELQMIDIPSYGEDEILVKVMGCAICGSDKYFYLGHFPMKYHPITMGHEFCGEVVAVGSRVRNAKPGDRVTCELQVGYCGVCKVCHSGATHLCPHKKCPGIDMEGAYAQYIAMPANMAHPLLDGVSYIAGALTEPAAVVATGILERCPVQAEEFVVIFGAGPLGLIALQMCKAVGASKVVVVEGYNKIRSDMAKKLGADAVIDDPDADVAGIIMEMTDGLGADLAVDCSGAEKAFNDAVDCLHKNARICGIGVPSHQLHANIAGLVVKAINLITTYASSSSAWDKAISMVARGALDLQSLVTHSYPLEQYEEAFGVLMDNSAIKVVFRPND